MTSGSAIARPGARLRGSVTPPGDKSVSHRAVILAALAAGDTQICGLLDGDDVRATMAAVSALGAQITLHANGDVVVTGCGRSGWTSPDAPLDMGNSGTACRLLMGAAAGFPLAATFIGDESLSARPMGRVLEPLSAMGVQTDAADGRLPATLTGRKPLAPIAWPNPKCSAQVKSCVLLAGLGAQGETSVIEPHLSRDHTERMLDLFGVQVRSESDASGWRHTIAGPAQLTAPAGPLIVPGDPSSAAFLAAAALITPGSDVTLTGVLGNRSRIDGLEAIAALGGPNSHLAPSLAGHAAGEPLIDVRITAAAHIPAKTYRQADMPNAIDEVPILAVTAAFADGVTRFEGFGELRVKESDRIAATCALLNANGVETDAWDDGFAIMGRGLGKVPGGGRVETRHDHRIAMSALVLGLAAERAVTIDDAAMIATSYPQFFSHVAALGGDVAAGAAADAAP